MVSNNLYVSRSIILPGKTDTVLPIDPHAELALTIVLQRLQSVARRNLEIIQVPYRVQLIEFSCRYRP